jgi:potassium-dependent mechanosensitive channel
MFLRKTVVLLLLLLGLALNSYSRNSEIFSLPGTDSTSINLRLQAQQLAEQEKITARSNYDSHTKLLLQSKRFVELFAEIQNANNFLNQGFDYRKVMDAIKQVGQWRELSVDGVLTHRDSLQTIRNLTTTSILLNELVNRTDIWLNDILKFHASLGKFQIRIDSLSRDSILYQVPADSMALLNYLDKLNTLRTRVNPVSMELKGALDSIQNLEVQMSLLKSALKADIAEVSQLRARQYEFSRLRELRGMSQTLSGKQTFSEVLDYSYSKAILLIVFYIANHFLKICLMILACFGLAIYLKLLLKRSKRAGILDSLKSRTKLLSHPYSSAFLTTITLFQFFLPLPPLVFSGMLWMVMAIALSFILHDTISRDWFRVWLIFVLLYLISLFDDFILTESALERWIILFLSLAGITVGAYFLFHPVRRKDRDRMIFLLLILMLIFEVFSLFLNVTGNYNLSKSLMTNGYFTMIVGLALYWSFHLAKDILTISQYFHKSADDDRHEVPLEKFSERPPLFGYLLIMVGWIVLLSRNSYSYQSIFEPFREAFILTRTLGKFTFTFQSIFIFISVLFVSAVIAKVVSFLTAEGKPVTGASNEKGPGSWLLLVRIAIISAGVALAFVAAGIPMDRLAIILCALSVGIGFGLQTLVNNLVSGLIIAFEKPINVGDIVEIAGSIGRMKSIGIRSSVVTTWEGADVIIPNGDLLNQHLVNWTLGNTKRRFEIPVGVAYGTNLDSTRKLLVELMQADKRILALPEPFVQVTTFNNSSIDLVMKFWVAHFSIGFDVRSDLFVAVDELFKEHSIVIPFPQQDVYIRSAGENAAPAGPEL